MPDFRTFLQQRFDKSGGEMSFEDFMAMALYDPTFGYYTTGITDVGGRSGDFATAATLSESLGKAVAGWIKAEIRHHQWKGPVALIAISCYQWIPHPVEAEPFKVFDVHRGEFRHSLA